MKRLHREPSLFTTIDGVVGRILDRLADAATCDGEVTIRFVRSFQPSALLEVCATQRRRQ